MPKVLMGPGPLATTSAPGQMSANDKTKIDNLQNYAYSSNDLILDEGVYTIRQTANGKNVGSLASDTIIGGTTFWDQRVKYIGDTETEYTCTTDTCTGSVSNGIYTATVISDSGDVYIASPSVNIRLHNVFLMSAMVCPSVDTLDTRITWGDTFTYYSSTACPANQWTTIYKMFSTNTYQTKQIRIYFDCSSSHNYTIGDTFQIKNVQFFNISSIFCYSTVAEQIYSLEQSTPGAGFNWFRKLFPNYYQTRYVERETSVYVNSHDTIGFNLFNYSTGIAYVLKGAECEIVGNYTSLSLNGEAVTPINNKFTPEITGELIVTGGDTTTCIHFTRDNSRNGEWEEYKCKTYPLSNTVLRGFPYLDENYNLYYDGDEYKSDGTIIKKYDIINLKNLTWEDYGETGSHQYKALLPNMKVGITKAAAKYNYKVYSDQASWLAGRNMAMYKSSDGYLYVTNTTYADATEFSAAVTQAGDIQLLYELETPIIETGLSFPATRNVDQWGIEKYNDNAIATGTRDVAIPVGHKTYYLSTNVNTLTSDLLLPKLQETIDNKTSAVILTYGVSTLEDFVNAYQANKVIYCRTPIDPSSNPNNEYPRYAAVSYVQPNLANIEFLYYRTQERNSTRLCDECVIYALNAEGWTSSTRYAGIQQIAIDGSGLSTGWTSNSGKLTLTTSAFTGATSQANGTGGMVPAPSSGDEAKFLRGDGTWATISGSGTPASVFTGATSEVAGTSGLVPAPTTSDTTKFLRGDGTWATITTYQNATSATAGLMTAADKVKLDNLDETKLTTITNTIFGNKVRGIDDTTLFHQAIRPDCLAFLPASQVIILQTTDGGTTWTDAGISETTKYKLFSSHDEPVFLPQIDGATNSNCGLKIIFTNTYYDVPANTSEINKYNYWNSTYKESSKSYERKAYLKKIYLMCRGSDITDYNVGSFDVNVKREDMQGDIATIANATGLGGSDIFLYVYSNNTFFYNHNIIITIFSTDNSTDKRRSIAGICGWAQHSEVNNNNLSTTGHLYTYDYEQNAIFPKNITASTYYGDVQATNLRAVNSAYFRGDLYVQCDSNFENGGKVATESYVNTALANASISGGGGVSTPMGGATASTDGTTGLVPAPLSSDLGNFLSADGTWKPGGKPMVVLSYGTSTWAEFEQAFNDHVIVYCRASSNSNPATGSQTRQAFMAYINSDPPTEVEFQYYRSVSSHSSSQMGDQVFIYKLNKTNGWSVTTREASLKQIQIGSGDAASVSYSSNKITLKGGLPAVTAADNGKILQVVDGVWTAVTPS